MDLLLVRHGQSEANRDAVMQGRLDSPLTELGRQQALAVGRWLQAQGVRWDRAYTSPLCRARDTALTITACVQGVAAEVDPDLAELDVGRLEGHARDSLQREHPEFFDKDLSGIGDYSAFGGESYDQVQARVERLTERFEGRHGASGATVLVVAHGGLLFQLVKRLTCWPVPRVAMLRFGNCTACWVNVRERRGQRIGELLWHVPVQLMTPTSAGVKSATW